LRAREVDAKQPSYIFLDTVIDKLKLIAHLCLVDRQFLRETALPMKLVMSLPTGLGSCLGRYANIRTIIESSKVAGVSMDVWCSCSELSWIMQNVITGSIKTCYFYFESPHKGATEDRLGFSAFGHV
jgi:hypothetical protein